MAMIRPETEMKDSGIEWVGKIPENWKTVRIKNLPNDEDNSFVDGDWIESPFITDKGIRYYTTGNIGDGKFKEQGNGYITDETFIQLNCKYAFPGDLIFSRLNAPYGRSCILPPTEEKCVIAVDNVILRTNEERRYICYVTQCDGYQADVGELARGTAMKRVSRANLGTIRVPLPPLSEQQAIADYLDKKCSKIDDIIAETKTSIEEYKELKQAIIFEAVTKGLDKNVEMKNSQRESIGLVPYHWRIGKLKNIVEISDGTHDTPAYVNDTVSYPLVTPKCLDNGIIDSSIAGRISEHDYLEINKRSYVTKYDVLMTMIGTVGNAAMVINDEKIAIKNLALLRTHGDYVLGKYVEYLISSDVFMIQYRLGSHAGVQAFISQDMLKNISIPIPNKSEMEEIVTYLDANIGKYKNLIAEKNDLVTALEDYKRALIFEYVTGKKRVK